MRRGWKRGRLLALLLAAVLVLTTETNMQVLASEVGELPSEVGELPPEVGELPPEADGLTNQGTVSNADENSQVFVEAGGELTVEANLYKANNELGEDGEDGGEGGEEKTQPVASVTIGNVTETYSNFSDVASAINNAEESVSINLLGDVDLDKLENPTTDTGLITIPKDKAVTLDLNGYKISAELITNGSTYSYAHIILNYGTLVIQDSSEEKTGEIINTYQSNDCTRVVKNEEDAKLTISGGTITATRGVGLLNLGTCAISGEDVTIQALKESHTGGYDNAVAGVENRENGSMTISAGTITSVSEAALFTDGGSVVITGGTLTGNASYGAMNGSPEVYVSVQGGTFSSDPTICVDTTAYVVSQEGGLYTVQKAAKPEDTKITTAEQLKAALSSVDLANPKNLVLSGNITLTENITLPSTYTITVSDGAALTVAEGAVLNLNGRLINSGTLTVEGFVTNPAAISGNPISNMPAVNAGTYTVSTPMELQWLTVLLAESAQSGISTIQLANDIMMPAGAEFKSLGAAGSITLDGAGHTISGLNINSMGGYSGLFVFLYGSTVKDLTLADCNYTTVSGCIGSVVGQANSTVFENVSVSGKIKATGASYGVGGIAGSVYNNSSNGKTMFINCSSGADIGGEAAYNVGSMFGTGSGSYGIIGIYNSSNSGAITAKGSVGTVFGYGYLNKDTGILEIIGFTNSGTVNDAAGSISTAAGSGYAYRTDYADAKYLAVKDNKKDTGWIASVIQAETAEPVVKTSSGIDNTYKEAVEAAAQGIKIKTDTLTSKAAEIAGEISEDEITEAVEKLSEKITIEEEDKVTLYVISYLEITAEKYTQSSLYGVDITPKYNVIASTADTAENIKTEGTEQNAVIIEEGKELEFSDPVEITIPLPNGMFDSNPGSLTVRHEKETKTNYYYTASVTQAPEGGATVYSAVFTNPHGFSYFEIANGQIALEDTKGQITYYDTLKVAVEAAGSGAKITLLADYELADGELEIASGKNVTLDLYGKTLSGDTAVRNFGSLTILDSVGGGTVSAALTNSGSLTLSSGTYTGSITNTTGTTEITGGTYNNKGSISKTSGTISITGGTFDTENNPREFLAPGYKLTANGDNTWTVVKSGSSTASNTNPSSTGSSGSSKSGSGSSSRTTVKAASTGDNSSPALWLMLVIIAAAGTAALLYESKRRKQN